MKQISFFVISILIVSVSCSDRHSSEKVTFSGDHYDKKWALHELNRSLPSDWSGSDFLTFDLRASSTQWFDLKLYDSSGVRRLTIHPMQGPWVRASIPLIHFKKRNTKGMDMAAISKTARPGYWIGFTGSVGNISKIDSLGVAMRYPVGNPSVEIRNVMLTEKSLDTIYGPLPLVDEFGQWVPSEWEGKAHSHDELIASWAEEDSSMASAGLNISDYGGFKDHKVKATGFFRIEKTDGKWWFVDPDGYLFYSAGSTCIGPRAEFARVEGREYVFAQLPPDDLTAIKGLTSNNRNGKDYSFYTWNLYRRFGDEWYDKWIDYTIRRMKNWGLNTVANWSDPNLGPKGKMPYVVTLRGWGIETGIMGMPDVYDPEWERMTDKVARDQCAPRKEDRYILGYFIGNEPPWPHREQEFIKEILEGKESHMKNELESFLNKGDSPERRKEFVYRTYEKFIGTINAAIKKYDPNHLNLGLRFGGSAPDEIILASEDFDVFSFNSYGYAVSDGIIKRVNELTGQPVMIGEFHFGVPERGLAPGLAQTVNQEERAVAYRFYVENAAAYPSVIGTHWFQWIDQPATGRFDGENYNIGFVDVTDRPYPELVRATQEIFRRLYDIHSGNTEPVSRKALIR